MNKLLSGRHVLVVEDEMMTLMIIEDMLADLGCDSVTAAATDAPPNRGSSSVDLEARYPLLQVGSSNRLDINEARAHSSRPPARNREFTSSGWSK